jgi:carboxyl-terminal processing protease
VITQVARDSMLAAQGIVPGLEILAVAGVPAAAYFDSLVAPLQICSRVQHENRWKAHELLRGPPSAEVIVELQDPDGHVRRESLRRTVQTYRAPGPSHKVAVSEPAPGIFLFQLNDFGGPAKVIAQLEDAWRDLAPGQVRGLIFDVRKNSGGSTHCGEWIVSRLISEPIEIGRFKARRSGLAVHHDRWYLSAAMWLLTLGGEWVERERRLEPAGDGWFQGPAVVLTSRLTGSAAEDFVVAFQAADRGPVIGENTGGGTGNGIYTVLPGYGALRIGVRVGAHPDGSIWQGSGIASDIAVPLTVEDVQEGRDPVLTRALRYLESGRP